LFAKFPLLFYGESMHTRALPALQPVDVRSRPVLLRRARLVALAVGGFLLPWIVVLGAVLPATAQVQHWGLAWTGLDGAEAAAALVTAMLLARGDHRASLSAAAGGTLLLIDAWFDVCTSAPGAEHAMALAEATFVELPLAIAAWWLAIVLTRRTRCLSRCGFLVSIDSAFTVMMPVASPAAVTVPFPLTWRKTPCRGRSPHVCLVSSRTSVLAGSSVQDPASLPSWSSACSAAGVSSSDAAMPPPGDLVP
jgi:hypothetical protein